MAPKIRANTYRAVVCAVLSLGLALGGCSGDDDDDAPSAGSSGSLNLSGATSAAGSSTGAMTSGGSNEEPGPAGEGGENAAVAGGANDGGSNSSGGSSSGGSSSGGNGAYLHCASAADCKQYGGGKVCCQQGSMLFCTKPSACAGMTLP
jgi:hypothetical protein